MLYGTSEELENRLELLKDMYIWARLGSVRVSSKLINAINSIYSKHNTVASESFSFGDYSTVNMMDLQFELQLQEMLKTSKASQTLTKSEMQDMLRKVLSNPIQLDEPKPSVYIFPYWSLFPNRLFEFRSNKICWSMTSANWNCLMKKQKLALRIIQHPSSISTSSKQYFQRSYGRSWFLCGSWLLCGAPS